MFCLRSTFNDNGPNKELNPSETQSTGTRETRNVPGRPPSAERTRFRASLFLTIAGILFVVFLSVEFIFFRTSNDGVPASSKKVVAIQLEVLNGTTEPNIAQRVTDVLRAGGFDVVDIGNYKVSNVAETMVIARTADAAPAQTIASFLGIDKKRVLVQPDKNLYLEVSVVVGKDIHQLRMFR